MLVDWYVKWFNVDFLISKLLKFLIFGKFWYEKGFIWKRHIVCYR